MPCIGRRIALMGFVAAVLLQPALAEPPNSGRPDLAIDAAEQLDHWHHRRHHGRCAGPYLDQPAPKLARCPGKASVHGLQCEMLRCGTACDRIRSGRQSGAGLGRGRPRV